MSSQDAAWVNVETPLTPVQLFAFITDAERLFRLNPYLEIHVWQSAQRSVSEGGRIHLKYLNEMNGVARELGVTVTEFKPGVGYTLNYSEGLKRATEIKVEARGQGAELIIKDYYHAVEEKLDDTPEAREARLTEADRSLTPWGVAIRQHLISLARWNWLPFYRPLRETFWLTMAPRNRRISRLIIWITALEFFAFLFVFLIYWIEYRR
ncbi:MAG: hypothetical protein IV108_12080 [Burkholderiales bacterium]|nr:hypothetical protein [Burkholderiales bacterium]